MKIVLCSYYIILQVVSNNTSVAESFSKENLSKINLFFIYYYLLNTNIKVSEHQSKLSKVIISIKISDFIFLIIHISYI